MDVSGRISPMTLHSVRTVIASVMIFGTSTSSAQDTMPSNVAFNVSATQADRIIIQPGGPLPATDDTPVLVNIRGQEMVIHADSARAEGYTIIDLSDEWVPRIFKPQLTRDGRMIQAEYAQRYVELANDRVDENGAPLEPHQANYLEVYGIHPTLSVLRKRFLHAESSDCTPDIRLDDVASHRKLDIKFGRRVTPFKKERDTLVARLKYRVRKANAQDAESLAETDRFTKTILDRLNRVQSRMDAFTSIEHRLRCEGLVYPEDRHREGTADYPLATALYRFRLRHNLYERWGLRGQAMEHFAIHPQQLNHDAFVRVIRQRIIDATGIIEDGSAWSDGPIPEYADEHGGRRQMRDLSAEFLSATLVQLGVDSPNSTLAFLGRRTAEELKHLRVGVKLPSLPPYYSDQMDLKVVIDRGTVWYDYPWSPSGKRKKHRRPDLPTMTLVTTYLGQELPLVRWPTTIGGWNEETDGSGKKFLRYKNSEVGSRVIRNIVAAPVWLPPHTTPVDDLIEKRRDPRTGWKQWALKDRLLGPGHRSAYGLVAGYLVIPGKEGRADWDRGIRIHGSANYLSITSKRAFSHGCHRMRNTQATSLFGFVLTHRQHSVVGPMGRPFKMRFRAPGRVLKYTADHRGFQYELNPPLSVDVLEGDIRGRAQTPLKGKYSKPSKSPPVAQR